MQDVTRKAFFPHHRFTGPGGTYDVRMNEGQACFMHGFTGSADCECQKFTLVGLEMKLVDGIPTLVEHVIAADQTYAEAKAEAERMAASQPMSDPPVEAPVVEMVIDVVLQEEKA